MIYDDDKCVVVIVKVGNIGTIVASAMETQSWTSQYLDSDDGNAGISMK